MPTERVKREGLLTASTDGKKVSAWLLGERGNEYVGVWCQVESRCMLCERSSGVDSSDVGTG